MGRKYQKRLTSQQDGGQFLGSGAGQFPHWAGKMGNVPSVPEFSEWVGMFALTGFRQFLSLPKLFSKAATT